MGVNELLLRALVFTLFDSLLSLSLLSEGYSRRIANQSTALLLHLTVTLRIHFQDAWNIVNHQQIQSLRALGATAADSFPCFFSVHQHNRLLRPAMG